MVPKLFKLIKTGTNIFDYPGLLTLGRLECGMSSLERNRPQVFQYWITTGGSPLVSTDTMAGEFVVGFDERGTIVDVHDLVCRF